ncbi:MAG: LLM class flavin-dependent oxidoreductase [Blastocatellales bacterium]
MKFGFVLEGGEPRRMAELAAEAEAAGWDGVFIGDALSIEAPGFPAFPWYDTWIMLAVMAVRTERIKLGTMITAVPRRRPWQLARETGTIDQLSNGRLIFGVGLGAADHDGGFYKVGEPMELKTRAERLDEGLQIINGLWSGKPYSFAGEHYKVDAMTMLPPPVQNPRPPVWVVGVWPKQKTVERALRWDGIIPQVYRGKPTDRVSTDDVRKMRQMAAEKRTSNSSFDIIVGGSTPPGKRKKALEMVRPMAEAGASWWLESVWAMPGDPDGEKKILDRLKAGPTPL